SQWAQMGMLGGGSGVLSNLALGQKMFGGRGAYDVYGKGLGKYDVAGLGKRMLGVGDKGTYEGPFGLGDFFKSGEDTYRNKTLNKLFGKPSPEELSVIEKRATTLAETGIKADGTAADFSEIQAAQDFLNKKSKGLLGDLTFKELASIYGFGTLFGGALLDYTAEDVDVGPELQALPIGVPHQGILNPQLQYAQGGVLDLQGGGESRGPGTGTSDSIPAMLSDGEFVMTADAVRGAGGGDRREGARRMYEAMDRLEARA
ncbi:hypothetical protein N9091_01715, partial [bacterium]|nr:hypothetical protein [bacterium]